MIHRFIKRGQRSALLLGVPVVMSAFVLLNTAGSTQSSEQAEHYDGGIDKAYEEVFFAINPADPADVYIQWDVPKATTTEGQDSADTTNWFLGAYKCVSEYGRSGVGSLCIALDRAVLTNNVICALHYFDSTNSSLYMDLLDTNNAVVTDNLYGNLTTGSDAEMVLSLDVPLVDFPDAAVIQLRCNEGNATVYESRIYIEGDESRLTAAREFYNSESGHNKGANDSGAVSGIYPVAAQTVAGHENLSEAEPGNSVQDKSAMTTISQAGTIYYVDQTIGDDQFTGRSQVVCGQDGPKKTIRNGLAMADVADTLIIKSGCYGEDLDLKDKNVNLVIEGDVKL